MKMAVDILRPTHSQQWDMLVKLFSRVDSPAFRYLWAETVGTPVLHRIQRENAFVMQLNNEVCGGLIVPGSDYWNRNCLVFLELSPLHSVQLSSIGAALRQFFFQDLQLNRAYWLCDRATTQYIKQLGALTEGVLPVSPTEAFAVVSMVAQNQ